MTSETPAAPSVTRIVRCTEHDSAAELFDDGTMQCLYCSQVEASCDCREWAEAAALAARPALDAVLAAMPWKRWSLVIEGDWENGWFASARSWTNGVDGKYVEQSSRLRDDPDAWGAETFDEALNELAARLAPQEPTPEEPHRTREQRREFTQMLEEQQCARCDGPSHEGPCPEEPA